MTNRLSAKQKAWRAIHQAVSMPGKSGGRSARQQKRLASAIKRADHLVDKAWRKAI